MTTVNLDFVRLYRPQTNVVSRPTRESGRGYSLVGHHELMIPLLAAALLELESLESTVAAAAGCALRNGSVTCYNQRFPPV